MENRKVVRTAIEEIKKRFPDGLPLLNPIKDMHISDDEFKKIVQVWSIVKEWFELYLVCSVSLAEGGSFGEPAVSQSTPQEPEIGDAV